MIKITYRIPTGKMDEIPPSMQYRAEEGDVSEFQFLVNGTVEFSAPTFRELRIKALTYIPKL